MLTSKLYSCSKQFQHHFHHLSYFFLKSVFIFCINFMGLKFNKRIKTYQNKYFFCLGDRKEGLPFGHLPVCRRQVCAGVRVLQRHNRVQRRQRRTSTHLQGQSAPQDLRVLSFEMRKRQMQIQRHRVFWKGRMRRRNG